MEHTVHLSHKMQVMHTCVGQYPYSIRIILDTGMIIFNVILQVVFSVNLSLQRSHLIMHTCARQYGTLSHTQV